LTTIVDFLVPQRYILGIMASLAILNAYTMRVSLSIAITEMVVHENFTVKRNNSDDCHIHEQRPLHFVEVRKCLCKSQFLTVEFPEH
jgi:hypothetical protein